MRKTVDQKVLVGERALFMQKESDIVHCIFEDGESPLKESSDVKIEQSIFRWKYPLWYADKVTVQNSHLLDGARAGIWYTDGVSITDSMIEAPKTFRRSRGIRLERVHMPNASETLWMCEGVELQDVSASGHYFAMNTKQLCADHFRLSGNYAFDGCKDVKIRNATLLSKDAFWNCENVEVRDSMITGEYIGWNSRNLTFVNCTIESLQGFCYVQGLTLVNCRLLHTCLAFEYCSDIDVDVQSEIESVKNPINGTIRAKGIGEVIFDDPKVEKERTRIIVDE
jgi:hypothetical protein